MSYNKETGLYEGYIYCITNRCTGKKYIGQTKTTLKDRFRRHKNHSKSNESGQLIYYSMNKYGFENFSIEEVRKITCKTDVELGEHLNKAEMKYIAEYKTLMPIGYNMDTGGRSSKKRRGFSPVDQYDLQGNLAGSYKSVAMASEHTGCSISDICNCCKKKFAQSKGYVFRYRGDCFSLLDCSFVKKYAQYTLDGVFIASFDNQTEAAKSAGIRPTKISEICKSQDSDKGCKTAGGYIWREYYANEDIPMNVKPARARRRRRVLLKDKNGNIIDTYESVISTSKILNISESQVRSYCSKGVLLFDSYRLEYFDEVAS